MGLVIGIGLVAEGGFCGVKGDRHTLGFQSLAVVEQGLEESIGHAGGTAILRGESPFTSLAEGVETAEGQRMAIYQQQQGFLLCFGHG